MANEFGISVAIISQPIKLGRRLLAIEKMASGDTGSGESLSQR